MRALSHFLILFFFYIESAHGALVGTFGSACEDFQGTYGSAFENSYGVLMGRVRVLSGALTGTKLLK